MVNFENTLERMYNWYIMYLTNLSFGKADANYEILLYFSSAFKNGIVDQKYLEFVYNKLNCPILYEI